MDSRDISDRKLRFQDVNRSSEKLPMATEKHNLLYDEDDGEVSAILKPSPSKLSTHLLSSYILNFLLSILVIILRAKLMARHDEDPSSLVWSPANEAVSYVVQQFQGALFNKTEFMGFPTDETDKLWSDLYNFGISTIPKEDAAKLVVPTIPIPGTEQYLIQLDVWHELHCLNDLRKTLYPERYPNDSLDAVTINGTIDRDTEVFRHWDHCIDALRQTLMCHADVSPISFHVNVPVSVGVFPRLATTHTCRDFSKIQDWARANSAGDWDWQITPEQAEKIIAESGFDHAPFEDIEMLWPQFPGNKFFKHWREHPLEGQ